MGIGKKVMNQNSGALEKTRQTKTSPADVISWSGCKDSQTSADTQEAGRATGAMSYAFISALTKYPQQSYVQLLNTIRDELKGKYDQKPQLSASHREYYSMLKDRTYSKSDTAPSHGHQHLVHLLKKQITLL